MSKKELSKLISIYIKGFEEEYLNTVNTDNKESIHEMRVSIKRIKALLSLFEESKLCSKKELKNFKQIKHIFTISGELREHQIRIALLENYRDRLNQRLENFRKSIIRIAQQAKEQYWIEMKSISFFEIFKSGEQLEANILKKKDKKINKSIRKFIAKRVLKSHECLCRENYRDYLHEIRKNLKEIRFITEQLKSVSGKLFKGKFKYKDIKKAEDYLGEWHDLDLFLMDIIEYKNRKTGISLGVYDNLILEIKKDLLTMEEKMHPLLVKLFEAYMKLIDRKPK